MGILLWILLEIVGAILAPALLMAVTLAAERLSSPLAGALRSASGARVLAIVWLVSAGWMWLGFELVPGATGALRVSAALISIFGPAILALWSTVEWLHRHDRPGRRNRSSAY
jgi:hypothetical protein